MGNQTVYTQHGLALYMRALSIWSLSNSNYFFEKILQKVDRLERCRLFVFFAMPKTLLYNYVSLEKNMGVF